VADRARYVDVALAPTAELLPQGGREYVKVLGLVVSKESVASMRLMVTGLILIGLLLLAVALFLGWRLLPGVRKVAKPAETPPPPPEETPTPPEPPEMP
jgi:hypothetical protein